VWDRPPTAYLSEKIKQTVGTSSMAFFKKLFKGPKAFASTMPSFYGRWGEPKPLDQLKFLELAEGDAEVRACLMRRLTPLPRTDGM